MPERDALVLTLRVRRDGSYYQCFQVVVGGPSMAGLDHIPGADFWKGLAELGADFVREFVVNGGSPLPDPTMAIEVVADPMDAESRGSVSQLPDLPEDAMFGGVHVRAFAL